MLHFVTSKMKQNKSRKQTLESAQYRLEISFNAKGFANLHCECQELKPKDETNSSFLVLHLSLGVDTIKTVGSHFNAKGFKTEESLTRTSSSFA